MKILIFIVLIALTAIGCERKPAADAPDKRESSENADSSDNGAILYYRDPMGGTDTSMVPKKDSMGMDYIPVYESQSASEESDGEGSIKEETPKKSAYRHGAGGKDRSSGKGKILYYRHPMGFPETSSVPKKDWMGMDYIPVYENETAAEDSAVAVPPETIQTLGVKIETAREIDFGRTIRTFGAVADNARLQTEVSSRVDGWIDELVIAAVGDEVRKGELLFRLRSPDLIAAQRDFVAALEPGSASWAASSTTRLKSLGLQERTIAALRARGTVEESTPFYAERDGVVSTLNVRKGAFVEAGAAIATISDYGEVWVVASIAEQDLPLIKPGAPATARFPNAAASERSASVDYVYPTVDPRTRTGAARLVLDNADFALRPGAYADVSFEIDAKSRLAVPSEAILRDQRGAHVIVAAGAGRFMPRAVKTGVVALGLTEIVDGLKAGDAVVVSGQFLIDSESSLRESLGKLTSPHAGHGGAEPGPAVDPEMKSEAETHERKSDDDGGRL